MKKFIIFILLAALIMSSFTLAACAEDKETVLIYTCSEEEINSFMKQKFEEKFPNYNIIIQYLGTGECHAKIASEGIYTDADIVFDLEGCYMQKLVSDVGCFEELSMFCDTSIYTDDAIYTENGEIYFLPECKNLIAVAYNRKVLQQRGIPIPETFSDLLDVKYKDLITITNPRTSGTGFAFYNLIVNAYGESAAVAYFNSLAENLKDITSSGSGPLKQVDRGDVAIGLGMLWQIVEYANENEDIGYTFLDLGAGCNMYTMGIIKGKTRRSCVQEVFEYISSELNIEKCRKFHPDIIYKNQGLTEIENYPENINEMQIEGIYDFQRKTRLLEKFPI